MYNNEYVDFQPLREDCLDSEYILSACFFKTNNHYYRDFSAYVNGLKSLIKFIEDNNFIEERENGKKRFDLLIFIDQNIYEDTEIMKIINSSNRVKPVLFRAKKENLLDPESNKFHLGLFGTFMRFFPLFNFEDNKTKVVCVVDIDLEERTIEDEINIRTNIKYIMNNTLEKGFYTKFGTTKTFKTNLKHHPYVLAGSGFTTCDIKFDRNYLFDFFNKVEKNEVHEKGIYGKREKGYDFGTDEVFLNDYLLKEYYHTRNRESENLGRRMKLIHLYNPHYTLFNFSGELYGKYKKTLTYLIEKYFFKNPDNEFKKYLYEVKDDNLIMKVKDSDGAYSYKLIHNFINYSDSILHNLKNFPYDGRNFTVSEYAKELMNKISMILREIREYVKYDSTMKRVLSYDCLLEDKISIVQVEIEYKDNSFNIMDVKRL